MQEYCLFFFTKLNKICFKLIKFCSSNPLPPDKVFHYPLILFLLLWTCLSLDSSSLNRFTQDRANIGDLALDISTNTFLSVLEMLHLKLSHAFLRLCMSDWCLIYSNNRLRLPVALASSIFKSWQVPNSSMKSVLFIAKPTSSHSTELYLCHSSCQQYSEVYPELYSNSSWILSVPYNCLLSHLAQCHFWCQGH